MISIERYITRIEVILDAVIAVRFIDYNSLFQLTLYTEPDITTGRDWYLHKR
jgi:hypothetical protein